jgi:hypothetical protein
MDSKPSRKRRWSLSERNQVYSLNAVEEVEAEVPAVSGKQRKRVLAGCCDHPYIVLWNRCSLAAQICLEDGVVRGGTFVDMQDVTPRQQSLHTLLRLLRPPREF